MRTYSARQRRSVRLPGHDYASPGGYFVTICTFQRELFFDSATARASAERCWQEIPEHAAGVTLDEWVVMPNHSHGIVVIGEVEKGKAAPETHARDRGNLYARISPQRGTLGVVIRTYKAAVTTACRAADADFGWQRGFYEHVIRNNAELAAIRRYIRNNPLKWALDRDHPDQQATGSDYWREAMG